MHDVIIVGGGPAGLSAATLLGRCRRRVLVCDAGHPRNACSRAVHGFLTRDGMAPAEMLACARQELARYPNVELRAVPVIEAGCDGDRFHVRLENGESLRARKLVLATGVVDILPPLAGLREFYGRSVHHCPYCDGWEWRDQPIAVYGRNDAGAGMALALLQWSRQLTLCTHGPATIAPERRARMERYGIALREEPVLRLEGSDGLLERVVFTSGPPLEAKALFFNTGQQQRCDLAEMIGCGIDEKGAVPTGPYSRTKVPGLYVVGDAARSVQMVMVAASEGLEAAVAINEDLCAEDFA